MRIHTLRIRNFRGIRELDWVVPAGLTCLVGPANSTKSTLLDAIDLLLTSRPTISLSDSDFYGCDPANEFTIEALAVDLPLVLVNFEAYGHLHCGITESGEVVDDPADGTERAMLLRLRADETLEPVWEAAKPAVDGDARPLRVSTRRELGLFRVDDRSDQHLRWSRGSHLSALAGDQAGVEALLTQAQRTARQAVFDSQVSALQTVATAVAKGVRELGGDPLTTPRAGLDPSAFVASGSLILHDGDVPLIRHGLGMRRLASLAIQRLRKTDPSILLIDEAEHGLEPHRLLRLVAVLSEAAQQGAQVLMTTHSPVVVESLSATCLSVVRSHDGITSVHHVPQLLDGLSGEPQGTIRSGPSAMLARRVLVVEGATEEGLVRGLCRRWDSANENLAMLGVVTRQGGSGEMALKRAQCLARLGFEVAVLIDHDTNLGLAVAAAATDGVLVLRAAPGLSLEQHLARDIAEDLLSAIVGLAVSFRDDEDPVATRAVLDQLQSRLPASTPPINDVDPRSWAVDLEVARDAIGRTAKEKKWFKSNERGEALADLLDAETISDASADPTDQQFLILLSRVRAFLYKGATPT